MHLGSRAIAAMLSVLLHLVILFILFRVVAGLTNRPQPAWLEVTANKLHGAGVRIARIELVPGLPASGLPCPGSSYVGIGVVADARTERILLVGDDTPASRAGLQHDDIVLNPAVWSDAHQEGTVLRVRVLREGAILMLPLRVGKICIG